MIVSIFIMCDVFRTVCLMISIVITCDVCRTVCVIVSLVITYDVCRTVCVIGLYDSILWYYVLRLSNGLCDCIPCYYM